jgi:hypothetical protein
MSIALLTCDRSDRGPVFDFCLAQVQNFVTSGQHIVVNHPPENNKPDLTKRFKKGWEMAKDSGAEWVVVVESDDAYPKDYLHNLAMHFDRSDFIGSEFTHYYHLKSRTWEKTTHANHSSLFTTAFRTSALDKFPWRKAHPLFLDIDLWQYARKAGFRRTFTSNKAIGIKGHGYGMVGGKGHVQIFPNKDPDMTWLKSKVDTEAYVFYQSLKLK